MWQLNEYPEAIMHLILELALNVDKHQITFARPVIGLTQRKKRRDY